jgi:hypothetical protein
MMRQLKPINVLICAAILTAAAGCHTRTEVLARNPALALAPTCAEVVSVFPDRETVPYDYYEVALIASKGNAAYNGNGDVLKAMRSEAAALGANGMILNTLGASHATVKVIGAAVGRNDSQRQGRAIAIWMPSDTARVRNVCGR